MAKPMLESDAISAFCESIAIMLSAGIQTDEAVHLLGGKLDDSAFKDVCDSVYTSLNSGMNLNQAMAATEAFPAHAIEMVRTGEASGRVENVLRSLAEYYDEEARIFDKIRSSVGYPAALLCVMSVILAFTVAVILPVFVDVYEGFGGTLTAGSFSAVNVSIIVGWVAFGLTFVCTLVALAAVVASRTQHGRLTVLKAFALFPGTKQAMYQLSLSRFTSAMATYTASGVDSDTAMGNALALVDNAQLAAKLKPAYEQMIDLSNPKGLAQAIYDNEVFEPVYARMLMVGARTGSTDDVLAHLSGTFFDDAVAQIDRAIDNVEPALAAFMTVAVGATLIAVMLPLIGIMGAIG